MEAAWDDVFPVEFKRIQSDSITDDAFLLDEKPELTKYVAIEKQGQRPCTISRRQT